MTDTPVMQPRGSLREWLRAPTASSPRQARAQAVWRGWQRLITNRAAFAGLIVLLILVTLAVVGPWLTPYSVMGQDLSVRLQPPSAQHLLGTDDLGRDILTRIWLQRADRYSELRRPGVAETHTLSKVEMYRMGG